jgi:hypothetical protein
MKGRASIAVSEARAPPWNPTLAVKMLVWTRSGDELEALKSGGKKA